MPVVAAGAEVVAAGAAGAPEDATGTILDTTAVVAVAGFVTASRSGGNAMRGFD